MKIATELNSDNEPTGNFVILDGEYKGTVLKYSDDLNQYRAKNWYGRLEDVEWISDIGSKNGQIVRGRNREFEETRQSNKIKQMLSHATADPITRTLHSHDEPDDINNRYNTQFNKNCSKLQNK